MAMSDHTGSFHAPSSRKIASVASPAFASGSTTRTNIWRSAQPWSAAASSSPIGIDRKS